MRLKQSALALMLGLVFSSAQATEAKDIQSFTLKNGMKLWCWKMHLFPMPTAIYSGK